MSCQVDNLILTSQEHILNFKMWHWNFFLNMLFLVLMYNIQYSDT